MTDENMSGGFDMLSSAEAKIDVTNPWGDDALGREKFAKHLTDLVNSAGNVPFCVAVDGGWGSGKTFFLKRWRTEFAKKDKAASEQGNVIYFDAWEDDFHVDPLTAIIGQLWKEIKSPVFKEICDSVKENWETIIGKTVKTACHYYGPGLVPDLTSGDLQTVSRKIVGEYLETRQSIDELKKLLKELADKTKKETNKPLVIVVDELDRCRPTFAIELLERVKHVVGVPGVVFVFGVNLKELEKSIKSVYGDIDSEDYLRRFFHPPFLALPQAGASKYCRYLMDKQGIGKKIGGNPVHKETFEKGAWTSAMKTMPPMAGYMELSLRQTEQAVSMLLFILSSQEITDRRDEYEFEGYLMILILLRIKDRDLYEKFFDERRTVQDAINTTMDAMFDFLPWEKVRGDKDSEEKDCIATIVHAFYSFYGEKECKNIKQELMHASDEAHSKAKSLEQYDYVPSRIIGIQDLDARRDVIRILINVGDGLKMNHQSAYASREKIAQLLEWGDYWQE